MIAYLTLGLIISLAFRYVLFWEGRLVQYLQFIVLWAMLIAGLWSIDAFEPTPPIYRVAKSLDEQCDSSEAACMLRARIALSEGAFYDAKQYLARLSSVEAKQMLLITLLKSEAGAGLNQIAESWLDKYPSDLLLQEAYAESLARQGRYHNAAYHYARIKQNMKSDALSQQRIDAILNRLKEYDDTIVLTKTVY